MGQPRSVGTHDGPFHADEVTACALLTNYGLIDRDKIVRTRDPAKLANCEYVCDVGGVYDPAKKLFDHHQHDYQGGLSSAGMVLQYLWDEGIIDEEEYTHLNEMVIIGVDAHDNGRTLHQMGVCTFSHIIANLVPIDYDAPDAEHEDAFFQALDFVMGHLQRLRKRYDYVLACRETVAEAMEGANECLVFDRRIPWLENFFALGGENHPACFVIMPAGDHWKLRGIPPSMKDRMSVRVPLPAEWAGLLDDELKEVSEISGAVFCHKGQFISVWETLEAAEQALAYTLKQAGRKV